MITEKFNAALVELGALAGTVPSDVWGRLRLIKQQLDGLREPIAGLETQAMITPQTKEDPNASVVQ